MATQYLSKVIFSVHKFILGALAKVGYETRVLDELISGLMADLLARYQDGMNRAIHLVHIERHKKPYTLNHYFNENLQKARNDRTNQALKNKAWNDKETGRPVVTLDAISSVVNNQSKSSIQQRRYTIFSRLTTKWPASASPITSTTRPWITACFQAHQIL
ncbi:hypothetical protein BFJ70_g16754 [Fusarium oxysporum]|uniref:Uncharacterized protein n=1 Tax=Fusarium oxysporum TaxID=5507 RepID=A0A420QVD4_FUSOX|nr:hypothetical protein BFJ71_g17054 [Fusarium oxysporum]RKK76035.1 hypothetical protein BFJ68_g18063 [Fusarium oxysporum]RKL08726.1 hypothetical protein BFJ70_g16754 [Fusarium oxysporum]